MKIHLALTLAGLASLVGAAGCQKSSSESPAKEAPITGKRTDPPAQIKAEWKPDQRYVLHLESSQSFQTPMGQPPASQETIITQDYGLTVTNAADRGHGLEMILQALTVDSTWGDRTVYRFDSLNKVTPNEGPGVEMLQRVIGGRLWFLIDSNNTVVQVEGAKELIERAQGDAGSGAADQRRNWMGGFLGRIYNADYFKQMVDLSSLPNDAVRIGDTWVRQQEIDIGMVGRILMVTTNTLRGWQEREGRKCARIEYTGTLAMKSAKAEGILALMGMKVENGRITGKCWFDPHLGLPIETVSEQACTVNGTLPNFGPRNQKVQTTNTAPRSFSSPWRQTTTLTVKESQ